MKFYSSDSQQLSTIPAAGAGGERKTAGESAPGSLPVFFYQDFIITKKVLRK